MAAAMTAATEAAVTAAAVVAAIKRPFVDPESLQMHRIIKAPMSVQHRFYYNSCDR